MKAIFVTSISLFALAACAMQQAPPPGGVPPAPAAVGGSAANTTTAFDGTYRGISIRGDSGVAPGLQPLDVSTAGCQQFAVPPTMTIANGLAQFQAVGAVFAGYVTPQGNLRLETGRGVIVQVNYDPQTSTFRGQANSINCRYDVAWQRA